MYKFVQQTTETSFRTESHFESCWVRFFILVRSLETRLCCSLQKTTIRNSNRFEFEAVKMKTRFLDDVRIISGAGKNYTLCSIS